TRGSLTRLLALLVAVGLGAGVTLLVTGGRETPAALLSDTDIGENVHTMHTTVVAHGRGCRPGHQRRRQEGDDARRRLRLVRGRLRRLRQDGPPGRA
ncbi:hypothetical protein, partial [Mycolicibacterium insubricum]|uniref:hypothetical protein n=1 Tax=Mycolicibacterium insubricum TaxID=444597 RepID=UPI002AEAD2A5|nr:hypothetical protein [Mycolicibacterium insubricum]